MLACQRFAAGRCKQRTRAATLDHIGRHSGDPRDAGRIEQRKHARAARYRGVFPRSESLVVPSPEAHREFIVVRPAIVETEDGLEMDIETLGGDGVSNLGEPRLSRPDRGRRRIARATGRGFGGERQCRSRPRGGQ